MRDAKGSEFISVILPVYNSEQSIEASVSSVLEQTYSDLELIIVDDASDDNTHKICSSLRKTDDRIIIIRNESNFGALGSRYIGAKAAKSEWIAFIDADDLWRKDKLAKQISLRDSNKKCDLIFTGSAFMNETGKKFDWIMHVPETVSYKRLLQQNIISNSSVLMRRQDYLKYAPVNGDIIDMHEDFACWLRMLKDGRIACGIDEPLLTYRLSKTSRAGNKFRAAVMNMNTYKYIGLGFWERHYYEVCYAVRGLLKHRHFL